MVGAHNIDDGARPDSLPVAGNPGNTPKRWAWNLAAENWALDFCSHRPQDGTTADGSRRAGGSVIRWVGLLKEIGG
jgi:hypothetical protein